MPKLGRRLLRTYERIAWQTHRCDRCPLPIFPGDEYYGEVWVYKGLDRGVRVVSWVQVRKFHDFCPWDEDVEREHEEWLESRYGEGSDSDMPLAA